MYISPKASRIRQREAQRARDNRAEIVKARALGQITRRDLIRWGIFTAGGTLVCKNGLSPMARSAFAAVPTGVPRSPLYGAQKFAQRLNRLRYQEPVPITRYQRGSEVDAVCSAAPMAASPMPAGSPTTPISHRAAASFPKGCRRGVWPVA